MWNRTRAFGLFRLEKNEFEKEKDFENKRDEIEKKIQKVYNQRNYL